MFHQVLAAGVALILSGGALAQQAYSGQQNREIKALSAKEVNDFLNGAGAGYAKSAELNHFPGPSHVLEFAEQLRLSRQQEEQARRLMDEHRAEARAIGAKLIEAERRLEFLFRSGRMSQTQLAQVVHEAAVLEGQYRLSHLEAHRRLRPILTAHQLALYDSLRGYVAHRSDSQADPKHRH